MKKDKEKEKDWLDRKYGLRKKGFTLVMEELKQIFDILVQSIKKKFLIDQLITNNTTYGESLILESESICIWKLAYIHVAISRNL